MVLHTDPVPNLQNPIGTDEQQPSKNSPWPKDLAPCFDQGQPMVLALLRHAFSRDSCQDEHQAQMEQLFSSVETKTFDIITLIAKFKDIHQCHTYYLNKTLMMMLNCYLFGCLGGGLVDCNTDVFHYFSTVLKIRMNPMDYLMHTIASTNRSHYVTPTQTMHKNGGNSSDYHTLAACLIPQNGSHLMIPEKPTLVCHSQHFFRLWYWLSRSFRRRSWGCSHSKAAGTASHGGNQVACWNCVPSKT